MVGIGCCWKVGVGRSLPQPLSHTHTCFFSRHLAKLVLTTSQVHKWVVGKDQVPRCCQSSRADPKCIAFCQVLARWKRVDGIFARLVNKAAGRTIKLIGSSVQQVFSDMPGVETARCCWIHYSVFSYHFNWPDGSPAAELQLWFQQEI